MIAVGFLCIGAALSLTLQSRNQEQRAEAAVADLVPQLERYIAETASHEDNAGEMQVLQIDGTDYLGLISIPSVGIETPVIGELTDPNLNLAPCLYSGSYLEDSMVVGGHNYAGHFSPLPQVAVGDTVSFQDVNGRRFDYQVAALETLKGDDVDRMLEEGWDLTLFTCTYSGAERVTVRCKADSATSFEGML